MVSMNTEHGRLHSGKVIFTIHVSSVSIVVRSDITKDDNYIRLCELIVLGKSGDPFRATVNITGVIDHTSSSFLA